MIGRVPPPSSDFAEVSGLLGHAWGTTCETSIAQYMKWAVDADVFELLSTHGGMTPTAIAERTILNDAGVAALLPILSSVGVVERCPDDLYALTTVGKEYLVRSSAYFVGAGLFMNQSAPLPASFSRADEGQRELVSTTLSIDERLRVQHSRNFAPAVRAVDTGAFDGIHHLLDVGGGSGTFAIPLIARDPSRMITLLERPDVIPFTREWLVSHGVHERVRVVGLDFCQQAWEVSECDGVLFGNVFHGLNDDECYDMTVRARDTLLPGGRLFVHEVLFNERRDGPLIAALWNANIMRRRLGARQRTAGEIEHMVDCAGFTGGAIRYTANNFSLIVASKAE